VAQGETIELRGVAVHNLKHVDLDIPLHCIVALCGVSGSGKTSLALDTLYAEGQRRYIESFSVAARQFLQKLDKPAADRIDGLPPTIAVTRGGVARSDRTTVGVASEVIEYLRLLYAKIGRLLCPTCQMRVERASPTAVAVELAALPSGTRFIVAFSTTPTKATDERNTLTDLKAKGFLRVIADGRLINLASESPPLNVPLLVVVDRLRGGETAAARLADSLETAFAAGDGRVAVLVETATPDSGTAADSKTVVIDGVSWRRADYSSRLECPRCERHFTEPEPRLFSFNSPLGACPTCEGTGEVAEFDRTLIVPNAMLSLRAGAIAPWTTPAYRHELEELLALAGDYGIPVDVPIGELTEAHWQLIQKGVPERKFGGLDGFFRWLTKRRHQKHLRIFMNRWRSFRQCPRCLGKRLSEESLAWQMGGKNIADVAELPIDGAASFFSGLQLSEYAGQLSEYERRVAKPMLAQLDSRLAYLRQVGLGYLQLDRPLRSLSGGEAQRVALTSALGSSLVNMLYVLDEPSAGLHARDIERLLEGVVGLARRGNSVIVVEHEEAILRSADQLIEIGPAAGDQGGEVVFQGTLDAMLADNASLTGQYLAGRRGISVPERRRPTSRGWLKLVGATGHNLKNVTANFPLGVLCVVAGVSGSGKSTLVQDTLYGAICSRKSKSSAAPLPYNELTGEGQIDDVVLVDQSPIGRSSRSNPVTYLKAFDAIRAVFAETVDARLHNYTAGHFSFNVAGGRCETCEGEGRLRVDMQFLADVFMKCGECGGTRYRREILAAKYRGKNIAEVLAMTAREAFGFFRGQPKVQGRLKQLIDVGLEYLQLGQPANTLSAGEAQRLKLASYLTGASRNRTLFLLDEPTTGLHFADVVTLLDCFEALLSVGHSLIVIEHNLQLIRCADYLIDLGPGAGDSGGSIVAQGTPEEVSTCTTSATGQALCHN
jgi:excinuclease ABC subunit A